MPPLNRLAGSASPYLRQHQSDPVDWYPWGEEALARAKELDRPLFLSIGYSACHWCHVMGHESFSDVETARAMNDLVVAIKIDREERPDIDAVYMEAVQAATGSGGWPMSVFATPDGRPFFAGTYFPDRPRHGSPAFRQVLAAVADVWGNRREDVERQADALAEAVASRVSPPPLFGTTRGSAGDELGGAGADATGTSEGADGAGADATGTSEGADGTGRLDRAQVAAATRAACERLEQMADPEWGGFGRAPKFPQPLLVDLLLRAHVQGLGGKAVRSAAVEGGGAPEPSAALSTALRALEAMAAGGIWDHVGGGFSRYSVDRMWLVPHFEKMLYDQALLGRAYLHAWQATGEQRWLAVLDELVSYVLGDLRLSSGALASAEDADSEGEEGRFYTWPAAEFDAACGPELAGPARAYFGVTDEGNFEGRNILSLSSDPARAGEPRPAAIEQARAALAEVRSRRVRPGLDDKVLTEWNAMMCATLAEASLAAGRADWMEGAARIASELLESSRLPGGRVLRTPAGGGAPILGYATDLAWLVEACVRLSEASGDAAWLAPAAEVADQLLELFVDGETGGLFSTGSDAEALVVRPRELFDNVTPSALSVAGVALCRLGALSGDTRYGDAAAALVASVGDVLLSSSTGLPELLRAADLVVNGTVEVAVTGDRDDLVRVVARLGHPRVVLARGDPDAPGALPLLAGKQAGHAYVCRFGACRLPVATEEALADELAAALEVPAA